MRRAHASAPRTHARAARVRASSHCRPTLAAGAALCAALALCGCGKHKAGAPQELGFEFDSTATDTLALARGPALLTGFEPYRASNGAVRVRGRFALPDGARLQISLRRRADGREIGREQVFLVAGAFDTPPFLDHGKAFPEDDYQFELSTQFNRVWQHENVLTATRSGLALSGPGMRRGAQGEAIYRLTLQRRL